MKELLYSGLILGGLAGIVGCDKSAEGIRKQNIMKSLSYGDPVAKYRTEGTFSPVSTAVGDMNGDGRNDIVISYNGVTYVFLNNDDGSYSSQSPLIKAEKVEQTK